MKLWDTIRDFFLGGPKLRCKPGDMAIVVGKTGAYFTFNGVPVQDIPQIGTVVQVREHNGKFWWLTEEVPCKYTGPDGSWASAVVAGVADHLLQPLPKLDPQEVIEIHRSTSPAAPVREKDGAPA
jgi:hypothetical protein